MQMPFQLCSLTDKGAFPKQSTGTAQEMRLIAHCYLQWCDFLGVSCALLDADASLCDLRRVEVHISSLSDTEPFMSQLIIVIRVAGRCSG